MIQVLSLPLFITASISFILSVFFLLLYYRLNYRYQENVQYYLIFAIAALVSSLFFAGFGVLLNSGDNLDYLNLSNRVTVIGAMFTIVLSLHFYVAFFEYKAPVFLKWCYGICTGFSLLAAVPNQYFLSKAFYATSEYYMGLAYGPLFRLWGAWILILAIYCTFVLVKVYMRQRGKYKSGNFHSIQLMLFANTVWVITGVSDTMTGIQVVDLPPLTWIGSFLVTFSIALVLVRHIDILYEEKRVLNERLMYDHLTQAFSRNYLEIRLAQEIELMSRKEINGLCVCVLDVDNFKNINDGYGHANGDDLLIKITQIIKKIIQPSDCVARLGGDEFVILFSDKQQNNIAYKTIEGIRKEISETLFGKQANTFSVSCSFGIASATTENLQLPDLASHMLSCADEALYSAKNKGKNSIGVSKLTD